MNIDLYWILQLNAIRAFFFIIGSVATVICIVSIPFVAEQGGKLLRATIFAAIPSVLCLVIAALIPSTKDAMQIYESNQGCKK